MIIAQNPYPARVCYKDEVPVKTKKHRVRKHDALFGALTRFEPVTVTHVSVPLPWGPKIIMGLRPKPPAHLRRTDEVTHKNQKAPCSKTRCFVWSC